jgi:hypothetical protein
VYREIIRSNALQAPLCHQDADWVADEMYKALMSDHPCMIARFGSTEMTCLCNYIGIKYHKNDILPYIKGESPPWWWESNSISQMQLWSGFFPPTVEKIEQFCEMMLQDIPLVDILGSWVPEERYFEKEMSHTIKVNLELLNPYFSKIPWTKALKGKKVVVVHPFAETIQSQYKKRELLFANDLLPEFSLRTVKAVQSIAGEKTPFQDWFEALDSMKKEIDKEEYDICLIGAGAYGFPLAAHVKREGKKGFHLGGSLQLLFGIRGKRWENVDYNSTYNYANLMNEFWTKPGESEKPKDASVVEGACYW